MLQLVELGQLKNLMTSMRSEPATFQLIEQFFNQLHYHVPPRHTNDKYYSGPSQTVNTITRLNKKVLKCLCFKLPKFENLKIWGHIFTNIFCNGKLPY
jgi:hypothetical protein